MVHREKLWTKNFVLVSSANFLLFISFYMMMVTLAMYAIEELQASNSIAGFASSIFVLGAVIVRPFAGNLIEKVGRKRLLIIGLVAFLLGTLSYFPINQIGLFLVFRFIHGFAFGISTTATSTIAADVIPMTRRGEGMGYFATSMNLAMAIGPFIGLIILQYFDSKMIFVVTTVFSVIALLTALTIKTPKKEKVQAEPVTKKRYGLGDFFEKRALPISFFMLIMGIANSSILSFINAYAIEIQLVEAATFFFVMYAVFLLISRPFTGKMYDNRGENSVMYPSILLFGIGLLILSQVSSSILLLLAGAVIGIGFGTLQSSAQTIAISEVPRQRVGLATSTFFTLYDIGIGTGPLILGLFVGAFGFSKLYLAMSVLVFISVPVYYLLHGKRSREK